MELAHSHSQSGQFVGSNERAFQVYALYGSAAVSLVGGKGWDFGREPGTRRLDHDFEEFTPE